MSSQVCLRLAFLVGAGATWLGLSVLDDHRDIGAVLLGIGVSLVFAGFLFSDFADPWVDFTDRQDKQT